MESVIQIINSLRENKYFRKYAIGGAMASLFYIEPTVTYDLDIMIILDSETNPLTPLQQIYEWANEEHYQLLNEHIIINDIPVQFLPAYNNLVTEAVENALEKKIGNEPVNVISPEYLIAIMIDTYRPIDRERAARFLQSENFNKEVLDDIITRFNLTSKYSKLTHE